MTKKSRTVLLILLCVVPGLLASCQVQSVSTNQSENIELSPFFDSFELSERCPHTCWQGINPEVTTKDEALSLLEASAQIDKTRIQVSEDSIDTYWVMEEYPNTPIPVHITLNNNIVDEIDLSSTPLQVGDFINYLGEPDQIYLQQERAPEGDFIVYFLGYSPYKIILEVFIFDWEGPAPEDTVFLFIINYDLKSFIAELGSPQPWLGYGHMDEYMPGLIINSP